MCKTQYLSTDACTQDIHTHFQTCAHTNTPPRPHTLSVLTHKPTNACSLSLYLFHWHKIPFLMETLTPQVINYTIHTHWLFFQQFPVDGVGSVPVLQLAVQLCQLCRSHVQLANHSLCSHKVTGTGHPSFTLTNSFSSDWARVPSFKRNSIQEKSMPAPNHP